MTRNMAIGFRHENGYHRGKGPHIFCVAPRGRSKLKGWEKQKETFSWSKATKDGMA